ncbi:glycine, glutamate and proline-rich protein-like [Biomphalaria glabrata]|uniref:Glycine, glutamate and proline-rich protein-like n=1 Tax=Biomphalaria glabrata TaxID=6526 RepID=A0A9W2YNG4_BIOGL|nr:glycine, glutamate and proline-rich protein-like [Biomphalaria glabrata]
MRLLILTTLVVATYAGLADKKEKKSIPKPAPRTCYGDVNDLKPTGRKKGGVAASNKMIQADMASLTKYRECFQKVADKFCIQASILGAIASRESRGGALLDKTKGFGDKGNAWGIMQCDIRYSGLNCTSVPWNSCAHIEMMTGQLIIPFMKQVKKKHRKWPAAKQLQGGVAAYNFGVKNVKSWAGLDSGSTGNDYSNDVIARAKWLHLKKWN